MAYVYGFFHKYWKLGPRGKKWIFIRYPEHSKGYVFIGEHSDRRVTEIESRDVTFLEDDFPSKGEVKKEFQLYEIEDLDHISEKNIEAQKEIPQSLDPSKSSTLLNERAQYLWKSTRQSIP